MFPHPMDIHSLLGYVLWFVILLEGQVDVFVKRFATKITLGLFVGVNGVIIVHVIVIYILGIRR